MGPVEVAGFRLTFDVEGSVVKVTDAETGDFVGYAFQLAREAGPLFNPSWPYRKTLGTRADDPLGSDKRHQIALHAKEVHDATAD